MKSYVAQSPQNYDKTFTILLLQKEQGKKVIL
jgi:hypothetical protein